MNDCSDRAGYQRMGLLLFAMLLVFLLSGCLYPGDEKEASERPSAEYITLVQQAIDLYHDKTGVLPLKNKEQETPVYEKYQIDFKKVVERGYLTTIPKNAYENGGSLIYVLVDPEGKPKVKLMDLVSYRQLVDFQTVVNDYMKKQNGRAPLGDQLSPGFYSIDYTKINKKPLQVKSPYSRKMLNVISDEAGRIALDYSPDIMQVMEKKGNISLDAKLDLRTLLVEEGYFVPAFSYAYHWINGQVVIAKP